MIKGQNTRRQFAGFYSQQTRSYSVQGGEGDESPIGSVSHKQGLTSPADILPCPLKEKDGYCQVYGTPCQYKNRLNCADYHEYRRRR